MDRRTFLQRTTAIAGGGLVLAACGGGDGQGGDAAADLPGPDDPQTLFVQLAQLELLAGPQRWLAFGITDLDQAQLPEDAAVEVFLRHVAPEPDDVGEVVAGPLEASYSPAADSGQGIWYVRTDLEQTGFLEVVARSGEDVGVAAIQVVDPEESQVVSAEDGTPLVPGAMAVPAPTPTTQDDRGVFSLCTASPPCGMHEVSLDEALGSGNPVVLLFATPQFCQTAVCGPSVETLDAVRTGGDWGDTVFVHSEIFAEAPTGGEVVDVPLVDAVQAWGLPTEPWLFTIGADGVIQSRLDGPMPAPILRSLLEDLTA